jgi:cobalt-precorrin-6B (C15)-methyltransferase
MDCAFIGGSKNIKQVLEILIKQKKNSNVRFVVSAVKIETVSLAMEIMKKDHFLKELLQIQISRGNELAGGTMLKPENPIFLVVGGA